MKRNATAFPVDAYEGKMAAGAYFLTGPEFWIIEKPFPKATLRPSIGMFAGQQPFHWHGFLRDGVFEEC